MDWLAVIMNIMNRVPIERVLFRPPDHTKALEKFAANLPRTESQKTAPSEQKTTIKPLRRQPKCLKVLLPAFRSDLG